MMAEGNKQESSLDRDNSSGNETDDPNPSGSSAEASFEVEPFDPDKAVERDKQKIIDFYGYHAPSILNTRTWDRQGWLGKKKYILIDLSGTLHVDNTPTYRAVEALQFLRIAEFKVIFVTNTSKESQKLLYSRLQKMGFEVELSEIFTSIMSTRAYLEEKGLRPHFMVAPEAMEDFEGIDTNDPNAVVLGLSVDHFSHPEMNKAFRLFYKDGVELIAIHKGRTFRSSDGMNLGPGPFVVALENATGKKATILGKPDSEFYLKALKAVGCDDPEEALMIGDDIRDDILGAMITGLTAILVETGKFSIHDSMKIAPQSPDFQVANFHAAVRMILEAVAESFEIPSHYYSTVLANAIKKARRATMNVKANIEGT